MTARAVHRQHPSKPKVAFCGATDGTRVATREEAIAFWNTTGCTGKYCPSCWIEGPKKRGDARKKR